MNKGRMKEYSTVQKFGVSKCFEKNTFLMLTKTTFTNSEEKNEIFFYLK